ncbi:MAG: hypothetical protein AB1592_15955 [Pseudomonadota bacterium]
MTRGALVFVGACAASYALLQGGLILLGAPTSAWTQAALVLVSLLAARGARRLWP